MLKFYCAVVALLCTVAAVAQIPTVDHLVASIQTGDSEFGGVAGPSNFAYGFEPSEGFVVGPLEPQNGFSASGANAQWASISNVNPGGGEQHLRLTEDFTVARGTTRVALSPNLGPLPDGSSSTSMLIDISNYGGSDYDVIGQAPSLGLITWRVKFNFDNGLGTGNILVLDDVGGGLEFVDTGVAWIAGEYRSLRVEVDSPSDAIRYFYSGALIYSSQAGIFAGTRVEQLGWLTDNLQLETESGDIDAVQLLIPEPASGLAMMLTLIAWRFRGR
ncbi:MAG: hypothetical protein JNG88_03440 [Phycisphaerales bacterium]|nr:hypothetical protein [Phycisphaerales bacterium]